MKLKTQIVGVDLYVDDEPTHGDAFKHYPAMNHDAAAAHALMQALREPINPSYLFHGEQYRDSVLGRALDLMEAWGYREE